MTTYVTVPTTLAGALAHLAAGGQWRDEEAKETARPRIRNLG